MWLHKLFLSTSGEPTLFEEIWEYLGNTTLLSLGQWPTYDEALTVSNTVEYAIQVNGKLKFTIVLPADVDKETAIKSALLDEKVAPAVEGKQIVKEIFVPGKIINVVVK